MWFLHMNRIVWAFMSIWNFEYELEIRTSAQTQMGLVFIPRKNKTCFWKQAVKSMIISSSPQYEALCISCDDSAALKMTRWKNPTHLGCFTSISISYEAILVHVTFSWYKGQEWLTNVTRITHYCIIFTAKDKQEETPSETQLKIAECWW